MGGLVHTAVLGQSEMGFPAPRVSLCSGKDLGEGRIIFCIQDVCPHKDVTPHPSAAPFALRIKLQGEMSLSGYLRPLERRPSASSSSPQALAQQVGSQAHSLLTSGQKVPSTWNTHPTFPTWWH